MIVNGEEIKGLLIKDPSGHIIGVVQDKGAYYFSGYSIEVIPEDMEIIVDPLENKLEIRKKEVQVEKQDKAADEDDVIIEGIDFTS